MPDNSVLPNANNVFIAGSSFQTGNTFNYQTSETRTPARGLGLLFERSALSARVDSNARYDAPKCDEGTREAIIQRILDWIENDEDRASALWLHGSAGSGKSALARAIAELCAVKKSLLATFFFTRTRTIRITDGDYLIPTLALQLTEKMRVPRRFIKKYLLEQPGIFHRTREVQMQELIINPLSTYFALLEYRYRRLIQKAPLRLIVIDGLDECFGKDVQRDLLCVLGVALEKLRLPVRFLIASRPEPHIRDSFHDDGVLQANRFITLNLNDDPNTARDIRTYLEVQFRKIRNTHKIRRQIPALWPLPKDITTLIERASGQFIFVSTVVGYVGSPKHNPVTRLTIITDRLQPPAADAPYGQLDLLYQLIFSSAEEEGTDINKILQVLGTLIIARPKGALDDPYSTYPGIGRVLDITPGDVFLLLDEFSSLIDVPPLGSTLPIKILHASLVDFLLDSSRSGRFNVDMLRINGVLSLYFSKYTRTRITKMTPSTHRDDLKHHFLPFITHWKNADIPANDDHLCNTMSLISEAMIFLCQCTEPCEDILWTACRELIVDDLPTSSRAPDWNEQIIKQRPVIIMIARRRTWRVFHSLRSNILKRTRNIGASGPEGSLVCAAKFGPIQETFRESEVIVIDIPLDTHGHSQAVLKWLKRLENMRINFSGVLIFQDVFSEIDWVQPDGLYRQIFTHCETLCSMVLVLMERSGQPGPAPVGVFDVNRLEDWQRAVQVGGTLLWSKYRETEQSAHQILWDMLLETTTWKQQRKNRHKNTSSDVLKEIGTNEGPISEDAWQRALQIARET